MSPLSMGCSLWCAAIRYTSYLLRYSGPDREILHWIFPLCLRIAVYSYRRLALDGHSNTRRISPGGALTLLHPVISAKSSFKWSLTASFHCSLSPMYFRCEMSLGLLLYIYNQQDLSYSFVFVIFLSFVGFHISFDLVLVVGNSSAGVAFSVVVACIVVVGVVVGGICYFSYINVFAVYLALLGSVRATYLAKMSSSVSVISSRIVPSVVVGTGVVLVVILKTGCVSLPLPPAVRSTFS
jgi:hypothetical protein